MGRKVFVGCLHPEHVRIYVSCIVYIKKLVKTWGLSHIYRKLCYYCLCTKLDDIQQLTKKLICIYYFFWLISATNMKLHFQLVKRFSSLPDTNHIMIETLTYKLWSHFKHNSPSLINSNIFKYTALKNNNFRVNFSKKKWITMYISATNNLINLYIFLDSYIFPEILISHCSHL